MPNQFLILQIAFLILSLLYVILAYFGYTRFYKLKTYPCEKFVSEYLKTPRANTKHKVIVSMTTFSNNVEKIKTSINSLLDQTVHADQIILSVPNESKIVLPDYLTKNHIITIHRMSTNYGKSTNFLSPILREKDADAMIILVDDQGVYGTDFIETMVAASEEHPNSVIYVSGYVAKILLENKKYVDVPYSNDIINVRAGVLVKPKFFMPDILDLENAPLGIEDTPDIYLSAYFKKHNISTIQIKYDENFRKFKYSLPNSERHLSFYASLFPSF